MGEGTRLGMGGTDDYLGSAERGEMMEIEVINIAESSERGYMQELNQNTMVGYKSGGHKQPQVRKGFWNRSIRLGTEGSQQLIVGNTEDKIVGGNKIGL